MNVSTKLDGMTVISLSRRNLEGLILQLDEAKKGDPAQIMRKTQIGLLLIVAEEDDVHYNSDNREAEVRGSAGVSDGSVLVGDGTPVPKRSTADTLKQAADDAREMHERYPFTKIQSSAARGALLRRVVDLDRVVDHWH